MIAPSVCGYCGNSLPDNAVSDYWCSQGHQEMYYRDRSDPIEPVRMHHRWRGQGLDGQIPAERIRATMNDLRAAFTGLGTAVRQAGEATTRLTDAGR